MQSVIVRQIEQHKKQGTRKQRTEGDRQIVVPLLRDTSGGVGNSVVIQRQEKREVESDTRWSGNREEMEQGTPDRQVPEKRWSKGTPDRQVPKKR